MLLVVMIVVVVTVLAEEVFIEVVTAIGVARVVMSVVVKLYQFCYCCHRCLLSLLFVIKSLLLLLFFLFIFIARNGGDGNETYTYIQNPS